MEITKLTLPKANISQRLRLPGAGSGNFSIYWGLPKLVCSSEILGIAKPEMIQLHFCSNRKHSIHR
jgi:hypothetical protein